MANRLTWNDIAAPDLDTALRGRIAAGELFNRGASSIGGSLDEMAGRNRTRASAGAMDAALRINDVNAWDKAMAGQGLQALGISPEQATPELMAFVASQRGVLAGNRSDDLQNERGQVGLQGDRLGLQVTQQGLEAGALDMDRTRQIMKQAESQADMTDWRFGREKLGATREDEAYTKGLQEEALTLEAQVTAQQLAESTTSREEARRQVVNSDMDPEQERRMLAALDARPDTDWSVLPTIARSAEVLPEFQTARNGIEASRRNASIKYGTNDILRLYSEGMQSFSGTGSPADSLISNLRSRQEPTSEEGQEMFARSAGEIQRTYNALKQEYSQVPGEIIAKVLQNNLQETGIARVFDGKLKFDTGAVRNQLDRLNTPEQITMLETQRAAMENENQSLSRQSEQIESLQMRYELALSRGRKEEAERILGSLREMMGIGVPRAQTRAPEVQRPSAPGSRLTLSPQTRVGAPAMIPSPSAGSAAPRLEGMPPATEESRGPGWDVYMQGLARIRNSLGIGR